MLLVGSSWLSLQLLLLCLLLFSVVSPSFNTENSVLYVGLFNFTQGD
jgi:hypothetical protein